MSKLLDQWIDLFRAGDYSADGKGSFTEKDLDGIVNNYDPAHYDAPSTIGHPKANDKAPAYGWWTKLRRVGDLLQGKMGTIQPEFEEALERKLYKKRSIGLVQRSNGWNLHHVAWLGAQAPYIKGLADIAFEQEDPNTIEIEFSEEKRMPLTDDEQNKLSESIWGNIKKHFSPKPAEPGAKTFSEDDVKRIAGEVATEAVKPFQVKLDEQQKLFAERDTKLVTAETGSRAAAAIASVKAKGAWVPAFDKMGLDLVFAELAKQTATVEFGEGASKTTQTPLEIFTAFMEGLGKIVPTDRKVDGAGQPPVESNVPANADGNSVKFHEAIKARQKEKNISYGAAMDQIANEHPELTRKGDGTAGAV
ncbi:MAG TPA: hypothetical protein VGN16_21150 [Acidobacteriaceae bacterium]